MCTSGSRRGSTELVPSLRFPGERFVIAQKLFAGRGRHPVSRSVRAVRRGYPPEQPDALAVGQRRHQRHYVVSGQWPRHPLNFIGCPSTRARLQLRLCSYCPQVMSALPRSFRCWRRLCLCWAPPCLWTALHCYLDARRGQAAGHWPMLGTAAVDCFAGIVMAGISGIPMWWLWIGGRCSLWANTVSRTRRRYR